MLNPYECMAREKALTADDKRMLTAHARELGGLTHKWQVVRYTAHVRGGIYVSFRLPPRDPNRVSLDPPCEITVPLDDEEHKLWRQKTEQDEVCEAGVPQQGLAAGGAAVLEDDAAAASQARRGQRRIVCPESLTSVSLSSSASTT